MELGVQSMDDRVLALAERGHTSADTRNALALLKKNGLKTVVQVMVGLPGRITSYNVCYTKLLRGLNPQFHGFKAKGPGKIQNLAGDGIRTCGAADTMDLPLPDPWLYRLEQRKDPGCFQSQEITAEKGQFHRVTIFFKLKIGMNDRNNFV